MKKSRDQVFFQLVADALQQYPERCDICDLKRHFNSNSFNCYHSTSFSRFDDVLNAKSPCLFPAITSKDAAKATMDRERNTELVTGISAWDSAR